MSISLKGKGILKKIALVLAGVTAITAVGFGVKAIVDYTNEDLKTISLSFEVGNLGSDGKFVDDKSTLYTKDAFGCYGLQVKPDFDSEVNYQIFYYDILDNYISSTSVLSDGYSGEAPVNGAYARMVIEPRDDEDGKIGLTERISYPGQLTVKVKKEQDVNNRFVAFKGKVMQVVTDTNSLIFTKGLSLSSVTHDWIEDSGQCITASTLLKVDGGSTFTVNTSSIEEDFSKISCSVWEFNDLPAEDKFVSMTPLYSEGYTKVLDKSSKYIIVSFYHFDAVQVELLWPDSLVSKLPNLISVTKAN